MNRLTFDFERKGNQTALKVKVLHHTDVIVNRPNPKYNQGDIVWVPFPFTDLSKAKPRPALIISNKEVNITGDYLLVQVTSRDKRDDLSVELTDDYYEGKPLELKSYLRTHKIFTLNEALILDKKTNVNQKLIDLVVANILRAVI